MCLRGKTPWLQLHELASSAVCSLVFLPPSWVWSRFFLQQTQCFCPCWNTSSRVLICAVGVIVWHLLPSKEGLLCLHQPHSPIPCLLVWLVMGSQPGELIKRECNPIRSTDLWLGLPPELVHEPVENLCWCQQSRNVKVRENGEGTPPLS